MINLDSLKTRLRHYPIVAAYLFGSQAKDKAGPLSDFDVAVLLDKSLKEDAFFEIKIRLIAELARVIGNDRIDLVVLNQSPSTIAMNIISEGKLLFYNDNPQRVAFEARAINKFLDRDYYENRYNRIMRQQILRGAI